jgi:2-pyrone-4,6-dicarboxylate lactonase
MKLVLPAGACNAHCHVLGPPDRFPYASDATYRPAADAPRAALYQLNDSLGLQRCVVIQAGAHGVDNRATEDAIAGRREDYRGIALLRPATPDAELRRLDRAGFRGVRFNYSRHLGPGTPIDEVLAMGARIAPLGWHLQIHGDADQMLELGPILLRSPVPVVIDHIGRLDASLGLQQPAFQGLLRVLQSRQMWVKVSGMDRISKSGPPYSDAWPFAAKLAAEFPDRVVWGNDWPHPNHTHVPDDRQLVDLIATIAPTVDARQQLLVDNPARLYGFGRSTGETA